MSIARDYARIRQEAETLAGESGDFIQRACVFHRIFEHSGGNHAFPLLAAHVALWGSANFKIGMAVGRVLSLGFVGQPDRRRAKMTMLNDFCAAFQEINRRVCVESYTTYFMTARHGDHPDIASYVPVELVEALSKCHEARRNGQVLDGTALRNVYGTFFLWEQNNVVGPGVEAAVAALDWPLVLWLAMHPAIRFGYFPLTKHLWFRAFDNHEGRIKKGMQAFDIADKSGWPSVARSLKSYNLMPASFVLAPLKHFDGIKRDLFGAQVLMSRI